MTRTFRSWTGGTRGYNSGSRYNNSSETFSQQGWGMYKHNSAMFCTEPCHLDRRSATRFSLPCMCTYRTSMSCVAAQYHIFLAQADKYGSFVLPNLKTVTTAWLSHFTSIFHPHHCGANSLRATKIFTISRWTMVHP